MNNINKEKLLKDFPNLYRQYYLTPQETSMCYGFDCDDGWFNLIYKLSQDIVKLDPKCEAEQVKQKMGGLRFYTNGTTKEVFELISKAEEQSYKICELCGAPGTINDSGWIQCRCKKHTNIESKKFIKG
jgi:hypothetical protein